MKVTQIRLKLTQIQTQIRLRLDLHESAHGVEMTEGGSAVCQLENADSHRPEHPGHPCHGGGHHGHNYNQHGLEASFKGGVL